MYKFKLLNFELNDGTRVLPSELTVFVGPNNVGRSRILKDIVSHVTESNPRCVLVKSVAFDRPTSLAEFREAYGVMPVSRDDKTEGLAHLNATLSGVQRSGFTDNFEGWGESLIRDANSSAMFRLHFGPTLIAYLSTEHRLQLVKESKSPSYYHYYESLLQQLYYSGRNAENAISAIIRRAFDTDIALDFSSPQKLLFRSGKNFRPLPEDPRDARPYLEALSKMDEQGDGLRAFVGIVTALFTIMRDVILVDEPETFLHPPQAFRIGEILSEQSNDSRQIIVATHSVDVLRGILAKNYRNVSIIRIDRRGDDNSFRKLDPARLQDLVTDPLLSSSRVLDGIFYRGAVVVEADSDARFYQRGSRKMEDGLDLHFVNADNKQTVPRILKICRELGVPCAGIVDIDVLNDESEFDKQLEAILADQSAIETAKLLRATVAQGVSEIPACDRLANIKAALSKIVASLPDDTEGRLGGARAVVKRTEGKLRDLIEDGKPWREIKRNGRASMPTSAHPAFDSLSEMCADNGLFINSSGELESMLAEYGIPWTTDKKAWIIQALQLLSSLEVVATKQPWKFIEAIHCYLSGGLDHSR